MGTSLPVMVPGLVPLLSLLLFLFQCPPPSSSLDPEYIYIHVHQKGGEGGEGEGKEDAVEKSDSMDEDKDNVDPEDNEKKKKDDAKSSDSMTKEKDDTEEGTDYTHDIGDSVKQPVHTKEKEHDSMELSSHGNEEKKVQELIEKFKAHEKDIKKGDENSDDEMSDSKHQIRQPIHADETEHVSMEPSSHGNEEKKVEELIEKFKAQEKDKEKGDEHSNDKMGDSENQIKKTIHGHETEHDSIEPSSHGNYKEKAHDSIEISEAHQKDQEKGEEHGELNQKVASKGGQDYTIDTSKIPAAIWKAINRLGGLRKIGYVG